MTEVIKIDGSPGAGKSYTLQQMLERERDDGLSLGDFVFATFTNAARDDVAPDVADLFGCSVDDAKGAVRTLHSTALKEVSEEGIVDDYDDQVISQKTEKGKQANIYQDFADNWGMRYEASTLKDDQEADRSEGAADKLFKLSTWLTLTRRPHTDARKAPIELPWSTTVAVDLLKKWEEYKRTYNGRRRFEHADYMDVAVDRELTPEIRVLLIDEFQDLAPQEYLYYKLMRDSSDVQRVYIAGDPNQSIYSFRAGTPYYFNETPADDERYLSETRRCPGAVADFARTVMNAGPGADTDFNARNSGGTAAVVDGESDEEIRAALEASISDGGAFLLARTNSKVYSIKRWLKEQGYPHTALGKGQYSMWNTKGKIDAVNALDALHNGEEVVSRDDLQTVIAHSPAGAMDKEELETRDVDEYYVDSAWRAFPYADSIADITDAMDFDRNVREALKAAALRSDRPDPGEVKVGTIHASKGLQRPGVLLFNSYNAHLRDSYHDNMDTRKEEHRVAYVGCTRASDRLYVVDNYFNGPEMEPIERARAEGAI